MLGVAGAPAVAGTLPIYHDYKQPMSHHVHITKLHYNPYRYPATVSSLLFHGLIKNHQSTAGDHYLKYSHMTNDCIS